MSALPRIRPIRLRLVKEPFDNPDYIFEFKHDGFRALAYIKNGECRLVSRSLKSLRLESLRVALSKLPVRIGAGLRIGQERTSYFWVRSLNPPLTSGSSRNTCESTIS